MNRKLLAYCLAIVMLITMLPLQTFAADAGTVLTQVTGVSVGEEEPWTYEFTLDTTGILNITIGDCSPGWQYKLYYPDGSESVWFTASAWSLGGPVQDVEITQTGTYSIALYAYNASKWSNVAGTVSATLTFTPSEIEQQRDEWVVSDTLLSLGENELTLDPGAVTTIYEFCPDEMGVYRFTANDSAALVGHWGYGSFYIVDNTAEKTNTLEWTITAVGQTAMIGISGVESVTLTVEKIGDYSAVETKWTYFENTEFSAWENYVIDTKSYKEINVIDSVADVIVKGDDGLYHYGSADGRVVVANLNGNKWLAFGSAIESGATFRIAIQDENGNYPTGLDMTDAIKAYAKKGLYPLTDELIYMLKYVGENKGWYDINTVDGFYLFGSESVDPETAYLAFCGTVCEHTWVDADCENAKTCSACGKTDGEALGHSYDPETHKCVCDKLEPITVNISWDGTFINGWEWTKDYGTQLLLPTYVAPEGYTFVGYAESEGGDVVCADGESYTFTKNVTLYAVFEKNPVYYDLWVQGIQVSDRNAADILGDGTVTYDAATNTLYLNNATIGGAEAGIKAVGDLNLHITGSNSITTVESETGAHGIYTDNGALTIDGTGSLSIHSAAAVGASYGILAPMGLHIKGGSTTAIAGVAPVSIGAMAQFGAMTVDSGATLTASGNPDGRYFGTGISTKTITGEGTINAIAILLPNADVHDFTEYLVIYGNATLEEDSPNMGFYQVMEGAVLTVAEGVALDMSNVTASEITLNGTIVNNGTMVLPDSYTYATIPAELTGGTVIIGESTYIWNGEKYVCANHVDTDGDGRCDGCGEVLTPSLSLNSISLKGNIAIKYYMSLPEAVLADENAYMLFTMADGDPVRVPVSQAEETVVDGLTYYVFSCGVAAKEMTDVVTSEFFYEGGSTGKYQYSVKKYADEILRTTTDEELIDLVEKMLHYGAASQLHFGYNTDDLANAGLDTPDYSDVSVDAAANADQGTDSVSFYAASLILKSETTLRFFFQADSGDFTVTLGDQELEVKERGGLYYVDVTNISAKDLDEDVTVTIHDGTNTADVTYNPMVYCASVLNSNAFDQEMKNVASALYLYNQAANAYLEEN